MNGVWRNEKARPYLWAEGGDSAEGNRISSLWGKVDPGRKIGI